MAMKDGSVPPRCANTSHNRPESSSGGAEAPPALDVAPAAVAWRKGGRD
jgi:hypothetical protein